MGQSLNKIEIRLSVKDTKQLLTSMEDISDVLRTFIISVKNHFCIPDTVKISIYDHSRMNNGWIGYNINGHAYAKKLTMTDTPSQILASLIVDATYEIGRTRELYIK